MKLLEERILKDGRALNEDVLKVDGFLNHQMDIELFNEMGEEWYRLFKDERVNKILTIEASGIGMACVAAQYFHCPVRGVLHHSGGLLYPRYCQPCHRGKALSESGGSRAHH